MIGRPVGATAKQLPIQAESEQAMHKGNRHTSSINSLSSCVIELLFNQVIKVPVRLFIVQLLLDRINIQIRNVPELCTRLPAAEGEDRGESSQLC